MDGLISFATVILILAYIGIAIWAICRSKTIGGSVGAAAAFLGGGFVVIPVAEAIASFMCWAIVICVIVAIIGGVSGV